MQAQARVASFPDMEDSQQFARSRAGAPTFQQLLAGVPIEPLQLVRMLCSCPAKAALPDTREKKPHRAGHRDQS